MIVFLSRPLSGAAFLWAICALSGCGGEVPESAAASSSSSEPLSQAQTRGLAHCPRHTPFELAPPADERLLLGLSAQGVQIYTCASSAGSLAWTFKAPEADLFFGPFLVGKHFAGPSWELFDGSTVVTTKVAAATVDATAVPWLLTKTVSTSGNGLFSDVTFVQRLSTTGGIAPTTGCAATSDLGKEARVTYTANYFFYDLSQQHENRGCR
jgi:hypothetical protein